LEEDDGPVSNQELQPEEGATSEAEEASQQHQHEEAVQEEEEEAKAQEEPPLEAVEEEQKEEEEHTIENFEEKIEELQAVFSDESNDYVPLVKQLFTHCSKKQKAEYVGKGIARLTDMMLENEEKINELKEKHPDAEGKPLPSGF